MYPNNPNQPQSPQPTPPPQPNQGWGQQQPPVNPQYMQQPQSQFQYQQQQPQPQYQASQQIAPTIPSQNPLPPLNNQTLPPLSPKKLPGSKGPAALLFNDWMKNHWKAVLLSVIGLIVVGITIFQIVYPNTRLLPGAQVDGAAVGGMRKDEAATKLNNLYADVELNIFFGNNDAAFETPKLKEVGINVVNEERINKMEYPFYLKLIPGSIFWANNVIKPGGLEYAYDKDRIQSYTESKVGNTCTVPAKDATLKLIDSQLQIVPSVPGGTCDITEFQKLLSDSKPVSSSADNKLRIASTETPAAVDDDKARALADVLNKRMKDPMPVSLGTSSESVPGRTVLSWLDFKSDVPQANIDDANQSAKLLFTVNSERLETYLNSGIAAKVVKKPGVSKVSTQDFTETSRLDGAGGLVLDQPKIVASVTDYINSKTNQAVAVTHAVGPTVIYTRSYTPTSVGYSALLAQFAQDNPGTYGMAITELSGLTNLRSATYNADAKFPSAGIESLYLGYGVVIDKYAGLLRPAEKISGERNVDACFKDMYLKSDEGCRIGFYNRFGFEHITKRGQELGLKNTTFANKGGVTSANDLQNVLIGLHKNQVARVEGGQQLISVSRSIRSNDGIPKGLSSGEVSHFVGESEVVHNDAALVYSNKGLYALSIVSDGSSWEKIADLTKKIQAFKQVKVPKDAR